MKTKGFSPVKRRKARCLALQALYQWQVSKNPPAEILSQYVNEEEIKSVDASYFEEIFQNVVKQQENLDKQMEPFLSRPFKELDPVELSILRLSLYELNDRPEIPYKVVINEGVELAKTFGATDGHKFINGVLDKAAPVIRSAEVKK